MTTHRDTCPDSVFRAYHGLVYICSMANETVVYLQHGFFFELNGGGQINTKNKLVMKAAADFGRTIFL